MKKTIFVLAFCLFLAGASSVYANPNPYYSLIYFHLTDFSSVDADNNSNPSYYYNYNGGVAYDSKFEFISTEGREFRYFFRTVFPNGQEMISGPFDSRSNEIKRNFHINFPIFNYLTKDPPEGFYRGEMWIQIVGFDPDYVLVGTTNYFVGETGHSVKSLSASAIVLEGGGFVVSSSAVFDSCERFSYVFGLEHPDKNIEYSQVETFVPDGCSQNVVRTADFIVPQGGKYRVILFTANPAGAYVEEKESFIDVVAPPYKPGEARFIDESGNDIQSIFVGQTAFAEMYLRNITSRISVRAYLIPLETTGVKKPRTIRSKTISFKPRKGLIIPEAVYRGTLKPIYSGRYILQIRVKEKMLEKTVCEFPLIVI